jgi:aminoacylase
VRTELNVLLYQTFFWFIYRNLKILPIICPAATDARFVRNVGIPAFGFSPLNNTPLLPHAHDEFVYADIYLRGIEIYKKIIPKLANLE